MAQEFSIMKEKQASGADFFMSQLCYDLDGFLRFKEKALHLGIVLPIDFGFLPVLNKDGIIRMALSNGCSIPKELAELIGKYGLNPDSFKEAGIEFSVRFIERALSEGIDGLHLYTLNKSEDVLRILRCAGIIA